MKKSVKNFDIKVNTLRLETSRRGGGIEIILDRLGQKYKGHKMTAYQNYLGGGMLGSIQNDCTFLGWSLDPTLQDMAEKLSRYFHALTNADVEDYDEWAAGDYEAVQRRSASAY